jgi:hypothetical protein
MHERRPQQNYNWPKISFVVMTFLLTLAATCESSQAPSTDHSTSSEKEK